MRTLISQNVSDAAIRTAAIEHGMRTLGEDGLKKVLEGRSTLDEVSRVVYLADQGAKVCPSCASILSPEFEYCTSCGEFVGDHCESCRRRLNPTWAWCPFCGENTEAVALAAVGEDDDAAQEDRPRGLVHGGRRRRVNAPRLKKAS